MPAGAIYVGRPTKWGNQAQLEPWYLEAVEAGAMSDEGRRRLLACWCSLDQPCHADVLLEVANS